MALKWSKTKYGARIEAENWSIHRDGDNPTLKIGWNFVCALKTEGGCKRVANCIHREMEKDKIQRRASL